MAKTPKNSDKLRLIKQEEEAFEDQHSKYETNSCGRRCKVLLFYGVLIGMLIIVYYLIMLGWQSYMKQFDSNETMPVFAIYGIPLLHIDETPDINEDMPGASRHIDENINKRKRRSPLTVIGIQSHSNNVEINKADILQEESDLDDDTVSQKDSLQEDSSRLEKILEQILVGERIVANNIQNTYVSNQEVEKIIDHQITEDEDKDIIHNRIFNQNKVSQTPNPEVLIYDNHDTAEDFHYKTAERKYMQDIYHLTGENEKISLGEIYYGIIIICGILLIIAFCLCIKFFYEIISARIVSKHTRLQEEQEDEINKRLNPLNCKFPSTPVEKDLRFTLNREKMDMFCDLYEAD